MKQIIILLMCAMLITSCSHKNKQKPIEYPIDQNYWYYYKSISLPPDQNGIHGGTFTSRQIFHIGDQTTADGDEVIEVTSEANPLK